MISRWDKNQVQENYYTRKINQHKMQSIYKYNKNDNVKSTGHPQHDMVVQGLWSVY